VRRICCWAVKVRPARQKQFSFSFQSRLSRSSASEISSSVCGRPIRHRRGAEPWLLTQGYVDLWTRIISTHYCGMSRERQIPGSANGSRTAYLQMSDVTFAYVRRQQHLDRNSSIWECEVGSW
jgi:hypothetical protein